MKKSTKNMLFAFLLNLGFSILELVGGIFTNSISIISDALHDFGDAFSIGVSVVLEKKSEKKANADYTFGYLRYSVLGALITAGILLIGSVVVIYQAICRFLAPSFVNHDGMLIFAIIGVVVNGLAALKTAHGHSLNEKTLSLHMLEDVLGWLAILVGSIVIKLTGWHLIDPILSLAIAVFVLFHAFEHLKEVFAVILEKTPENICVAELKQALKTVGHVKEVHHLHLWSLDGTVHCASLHALIDESCAPLEFEEIKHRLRHVLELGGISHATIEMEYRPCAHEACEIKPASHGHHHGHCH